jgi:flagellar hook-length control protein FliK
LAVGIDPQILATQIPVPGDEDAAPGHDASQESADAVPSGNGAEQGSASGRFALNNRSLLALNPPDQPAGASRGAQTAMAHASDQALAHASSNSELNPADADSLCADAQGVDGRPADDSLLDPASSATLERAERASNGHKSGRAAVRDIARSFSAATREPQSAGTAVAAPASDAAIQPSSARSTTLDGTVQTDPSHRLSIAMEAAARRSDMAAIPSIRFADIADTDAGAQGNLEDPPRDQHQQPSASAMTRLMSGVVSAAGDAHAGTQPHAVAPAFSVPTTPAASATPAVTPTETAAPANAAAPDAQNIDRLVQSMHVNAKSGVMEATVRLRPDYLGDVTIELRVDGTGVSAVVRAESASVRQWLESHEQTIRSGLAEHGLELTRFIVDPDGQPQSQQDTQPDRDEQRRAAFRRRQQEGSSQRFEITV